MSCKHEDSGWCYNLSLRNGHNAFACLGEEACPETADQGQKLSRIDIIGPNGNDGQHYLVEKIAKVISTATCHPIGTCIPVAIKIMEVIENE